eukprot:TRINITY_DN2083_c0_g1_i1.p1 TRINITY_DN2083_c0_g1~~TRINITY_DN2083_c0_g1_i1.p1  ORF type:complete len:406 (-),score=51.25 TRINITY_DN2083_c0_g1_i1:31-1224(-)
MAHSVQSDGAPYLHPRVPPSTDPDSRVPFASAVPPQYKTNVYNDIDLMASSPSQRYQRGAYDPISPHQVVGFDESTDEMVLPHRVIFCYITMVALAAAFVVQLWKADWKFVPISENPFFGTSAVDMISCGAEVGSCIVTDHQWWRLFSSQIMHGGLVHLASNVWVLYSVGGDLERHFGALRVATLYMLAGTFAALATAIFLPNAVAVGASGAICGLFGAYWSDFILNNSFYKGQRCRTFFSLAFNTAMLVAISLLPYVNFFAHGGGFICGFFGGLFLLIRPRRSRDATCSQLCLAWVGAAVLILTFALEVLALYFVVDPYKYCGWCKYAECLPTPLWECNTPMCGYSIDGNSCVVSLACMAGENVNVTGQCTRSDNNEAISGLCRDLCPRFCGNAFF